MNTFHSHSNHMVLIACVALLSACTGPMGPMGPAGQDGEDGPIGPAGQDGQDGQRGPQGPAGQDGQDGASARIIESFFCTALLEGTTINSDYSAVLLESGDVFVTGTLGVADVSISSAKFWSVEQVGYDSAIVFVGTLDLMGQDNGGWWTIELDRSTFSKVTTYHDSDLTGGERSWTSQGPSTCVHNFY
jgi:Collagen triple helix repeat (20 copies)